MRSGGDPCGPLPYLKEKLGAHSCSVERRDTALANLQSAERFDYVFVLPVRRLEPETTGTSATNYFRPEGSFQGQQLLLKKRMRARRVHGMGRGKCGFQFPNTRLQSGNLLVQLFCVGQDETERQGSPQ